MFLFNGSAGLGDKNQRRADDSLEASVTGSLDSESSTGELHFYLPVADCTTIEVESALKSGISASISLVKGYLLAPSLQSAELRGNSTLVAKPFKITRVSLKTPAVIYIQVFDQIIDFCPARRSAVKGLRVFYGNSRSIRPITFRSFYLPSYFLCRTEEFLPMVDRYQALDSNRQKKTGTACEIATTRGGCQQTSFF